MLKAASMTSHITFVPSTPRLNALAAAIILDDRRPFPVEEGTRLDQYAHSSCLDDIKKEIIRMVCLHISLSRVSLICLRV
jgi:hypothetical protein